MKRSVLLFFFTLLFIGFGSSTVAQFTTVDWGQHNVGRFTELVNNRGSLHPYALDSYPPAYGLTAEFPRGSLIEHHNAIAPFYASLSKNKQDTMVSTARIWAWNSANELDGYSTAPWDSVWVIESDTTPRPPYWPNYKVHSDQDIVTRYNDYNRASLRVSDHKPLFIDVYHRSWTWSSPPLDQFAIINLDVIATQKSLNNLWTGIFFNPSVGYTAGKNEGLDDYVTYHPKHNMIIAHDAPGNERPKPAPPMGLKVLLSPKMQASTNLDTTFQWSLGGGLRVTRDNSRYQQLTRGQIQSDQTQDGNAQSLFALGPISNITVGDTLSWQYATIYGMTEKVLLEKSALIDTLAPGFHVPSAPPTPQVNVDRSSRTVTLTWGENAETYVDTNRTHDQKNPFEGYRVYKSTRSATGPWTLLAEYDLKGNTFGQNTGLRHKYIDTGLMNNVEYFYAVTAFSKPDTSLNFPPQATSLTANALSITPGTAPPDSVGKVAVVPNPYRGDIDYTETTPPWEKPPPTRDRWLEQDRKIQFIHLPAHSTIKIYTLSGRIVETITHNNPNKGFHNWNLTSEVNQAVASGIYLFTVKNHETGRTQTGKFVIIK